MNDTTTPRMRQLQQLLDRQPNDTFLLYGMALEFKKLRDADRALEYLDRVIALDHGYCYAYHQKGQVLEELGQLDSAKEVYREGIKASQEVGDGHAAGEIEAALAALE